MVLEQMALAQHLPGKVGILDHALAHTKESGRDAAVVQEFEQLRRGAGVGAVVESDGYLVLLTIAAADERPEHAQAGSGDAKAHYNDQAGNDTDQHGHVVQENGVNSKQEGDDEYDVMPSHGWMQQTAFAPRRDKV